MMSHRTRYLDGCGSVVKSMKKWRRRESGVAIPETVTGDETGKPKTVEKTRIFSITLQKEYTHICMWHALYLPYSTLCQPRGSFE